MFFEEGKKFRAVSLSKLASQINFPFSRFATKSRAKKAKIQSYGSIKDISFSKAHVSWKCELYRLCFTIKYFKTLYSVFVLDWASFDQNSYRSLVKVLHPQCKWIPRIDPLQIATKFIENRINTLPFLNYINANGTAALFSNYE